MVFTGTCLPVAIVAGLVAYLFSLPILSAHFLKHPKLPRAVEDSVMGMSENRSPAEAAIWNGLEADSMTYVEIFDTLICRCFERFVSRPGRFNEYFGSILDRGRFARG